MILYHGSNVIVQEPQILENGFYKDFGNWLSLNIRHIRLYSVQKKHYRLSNSKGVIRYEKQIFPGRANIRE